MFSKTEKVLRQKSRKFLFSILSLSGTRYMLIANYITKYARYTMLKNNLLWFTLGYMIVMSIKIEL